MSAHDGSDWGWGHSRSSLSRVADSATEVGSGRIGRDGRVLDPSSPRDPGADRRAAYRLPLESGRAGIEVRNAGQSELRDISALGGSLLVRDLQAFPPGALVSATLHLANEPSFHTYLRVVRRSRAPETSAFKVGVSFSSLDPSALGALSRFMVREYVNRGLDVGRLLESPVAVRSEKRKSIVTLIRGAAIRDKARLQVFSEGSALAPRVQIVALVGEPGSEQLAGLVHGDAREIEAGDALTFLIPGASSVVLFESVVSERHGPHLVMSLPTELTQTGFRDSHRTATAPDEAVSISFPHPHLPGRTIARKVLDLSARGLAFSLDSENDILFPGDHLPDINLTLPDGAELCANATIRSMRRGKGSHLHCGIELSEFGSERQQRLWRRFTFQHEHPRLNCSASEAIRQAWNVYESSAYLDKWIADGRASQVFQEFSNDWLQLGQDSGRLLVLNEREVPTATVALNQSYPHTWLLHGLAVDKAQRERSSRDQFIDVARELYSAITYTLQHTAGCKYFLSYFGQDTPWNQRLCGDFAESYASDGDQLYDFAHVWRKRVTGNLATVAVPDGIRITRANAADRSLIASYAERNFPKLLVDALSLHETELDLTRFSETVALKGLYRSREIFVVYENGTPLMAAICETGGAGINIFGLMNLCWTIPMAGRTPSPQGFSALMAAVTQHYQRSEAPEFLLLEELGARFELLSSLGFSDVGPGVRWLAKVEILPAWLAYVENELAALRSRPKQYPKTLARR